MTVTVPWILGREYAQHRSLDPDGLPERFEDWCTAQKRICGMLAEVLRQRVVRVVIRPRELESWAMRHGVAIDDGARAQLAADLWKQKR